MRRRTKDPGEAAADATATFFAELALRGHEPLLQKATASLRFDLSDGGRIDHWLVSVKKGDLTVTRDNADADCVLRADRTLFDGIATGEVNVVAAMLRGAIGLEGEPELLVTFNRLFPGPPGSIGGRRGAEPERRRP